MGFFGAICNYPQYALGQNPFPNAEIDIELENAVIEFKFGRRFNSRDFVNQMRRYHSSYYNFGGKKVYWFAQRMNLNMIDTSRGMSRRDVISNTGATPYGKETSVEQFVNVIGWAT